MSERRLRLRSIVDAQFVLLVAAFVLVAAVGGVLTTTAYATEETETITEEVPVGSWSLSTDLDHSATVQGGSSVYQPGEELENQGLYFTTVSPELDGELVVDYDTSEFDEVAVETETELVIESRLDEALLWDDRTQLATASSDAGSDQLRTEFTVDVPELEDRIAEIEDELGASPGTEHAAVVIEVVLTGSADGEPVSERIDLELGIDPGGATYTVDSPGSETAGEEVTRTTQQEVPVEPDPLSGIGGPVLLVVGLAGVGALTFARRRDRLELTPAERDWLAYRDDRAEYEEWLVTVDQSHAVEGMPTARAESLADLAKFAIDCDSAVTEDPETGTCYVRHDGVCYVYRPPGRPPGVEPPPERAVDDALVESGDPVGDSAASIDDLAGIDATDADAETGGASADAEAGTDASAESNAEAGTGAEAAAAEPTAEPDEEPSDLGELLETGLPVDPADPSGIAGEGPTDGRSSDRGSSDGSVPSEGADLEPSGPAGSVGVGSAEDEDVND